MSQTATNPYQSLLTELSLDNISYKFYDISKLEPAKFARLPFSIRVLLESVVRCCDGFLVHDADVRSVLDWEKAQNNNVEIPFRPSRVILQDLTGVAALVDFAAMRDAFKRLGGSAEKVNPLCPTDLVIDHSVQVDYSRVAESLEKNQDLEFARNKERFQFLKWSSKSLQNMTIVPPGSGICHQVNLEYLARVVFKSDDNILFPDSLVGADSHTTMINGLGIVGWGVGGIEAEAVMLGQPVSLVIPQVVGYKLMGSLPPLTTSTDLVLTITKHLRQVGVVGKFVEFFGPGVAQLSIADRATIANMCPEYGATIGFFPVDEVAISYLQQTGREQRLIELIKKYLIATKMFRNYDDNSQDPVFSQVIELDLASIVPSLSGPKRPQDKVAVSEMREDFLRSLTNKPGFKGFGLSGDKVEERSKLIYEGEEFSLAHGSVVIAAITSCTNTSNPSVMLGAGLLAKKAVEKGLRVLPYIKTSMSPGSGVVTYYLRESGVSKYLEKLGFDIVGYGCMTCIGNSGPLPEPIVEAIESKNLVVAGVLSGNRNFEGRIHPNTRANYLASPILVVAYALAGTIVIDFDKDPIGKGNGGEDVFLRDIWPSREEIQQVEQKFVIPAMFKEVYSKVETGNEKWNSLSVAESLHYPWDPSSTYIKCPPFFDDMTVDLAPMKPIQQARVLLNFGDSVTTDHISPAGTIARSSPAAKYLMERGVDPKDFNSYGSRRGHDEVMARGTFANIRLVNKLIPKQGSRTLHIPSNQELSVFDAAELYKKEGTPLIILAGKEYGTGSSRDWAAKGPLLQGVRAVIAESFERIHRSNLIGMGIMPLQFLKDESATSLGLSGFEIFTIDIPQSFSPGSKTTVMAEINGIQKKFEVLIRFDTEIEIQYFMNGGILQFMLRRMLKRG